MTKLSINRDTQLCMSLAGRPGNFGTRFQNYLYDEMGLNYVYKAFKTDDLAAAIAGVRAIGVRGCALSMPFKEACIPMLDSLDASAAEVGAVNTIVNNGSHLVGYNTDYLGTINLIRQNNLSPDLDFIIFGSGGMAKAVAVAFRDVELRLGTVVARNEPAGRAIAVGCGYGWKSELRTRPKILVNTTPIGMAGGASADDLPFEEDAIAQASLIFDVVAIPAETPLIRKARTMGKNVLTGTQVHVLQGVEQFALYTGVRPTPEQIHRAAQFASE
jgi:shikimate dehydrogenase